MSVGISCFASRNPVRNPEGAYDTAWLDVDVDSVHIDDDGWIFVWPLIDCVLAGVQFVIDDTGRKFWQYHIYS